MIENFKWTPADEHPPINSQIGSSEYILISFSNWSLPDIGRYEEDEARGVHTTRAMKTKRIQNIN